MNGFICIDKPSGPSSFAVVRAARAMLGVKKAGHAGTLDPMASGLMVIALGSSTRLLEYLSLEPKIYEFSVTFGRSTDTLDAEGDVVAESAVIPPESRLIDVLKNFTGSIEQIPPRYSAIKIDGARAYDLARKGVEVEMKPRVVNIYAIEMCGYDGGEGRADFTVSCSAGTYIRSLARDIVKAADINAESFVNRLHRTKTGRFDLSMAADYASMSDAENYIIDTGSAFGDDEKVIIADRQKIDISRGREITIDGIDKNKIGDILIAFDESGFLLAALKKIDTNRYHPQKVFYQNTAPMKNDNTYI
ncbi:MAG: tRNA pseudouridine(55) synthase TruB [Chitinispirillales bacterium]|jgi:tRNA pseudouridine55 synthase|nr:tRNA pseudouridine(55) synthase TruB [Chitinispirillales bacterium]